MRGVGSRWQAPAEDLAEKARALGRNCGRTAFFGHEGECRRRDEGMACADCPVFGVWDAARAVEKAKSAL